MENFYIKNSRGLNLATAEVMTVIVALSLITPSFNYRAFNLVSIFDGNDDLGLGPYVV
jgi:hypothetical protein